MKIEITKMSARQLNSNCSDGIWKIEMMESFAFVIKKQLSKLHTITSRKTDLICNSCTEFIVYYMIMVYKKNLAQEWLLGVFLHILVLG